MLFYITALINMSLVGGIEPPTGWLQDTTPYATQIECEQALPMKMAEFTIALRRYTQGLGTIDEIVCITEKEWVQRNNDLGHPTPEDWKSKESETLQ